MTKNNSHEVEMTLVEALHFADEQIKDTSLSAGKRDSSVALRLLANEVRRLQKRQTSKYKLSDLLREMDTDASLTEDLKAWLEMQPVGMERVDAFGVLADAALASVNRTSNAIEETLTYVEESNKRIMAMENKAAKKKSE